MQSVDDTFSIVIIVNETIVTTTATPYVPLPAPSSSTPEKGLRSKEYYNPSHLGPKRILRRFFCLFIVLSTTPPSPLYFTIYNYYCGDSVHSIIVITVRRRRGDGL